MIVCVNYAIWCKLLAIKSSDTNQNEFLTVPEIKKLYNDPLRSLNDTSQACPCQKNLTTLENQTTSYELDELCFDFSPDIGDLESTITDLRLPCVFGDEKLPSFESTFQSTKLSNNVQFNNSSDAFEKFETCAYTELIHLNPSSATVNCAKPSEASANCLFATGNCQSNLKSVQQFYSLERHFKNQFVGLEHNKSQQNTRTSKKSNCHKRKYDTLGKESSITDTSPRTNLGHRNSTYTADGSIYKKVHTEPVQTEMTPTTIPTQLKNGVVSTLQQNMDETKDLNPHDTIFEHCDSDNDDINHFTINLALTNTAIKPYQTLQNGIKDEKIAESTNLSGDGVGLGPPEHSTELQCYKFFLKRNIDAKKNDETLQKNQSLDGYPGHTENRDNLQTVQISIPDSEAFYHSNRLKMTYESYQRIVCSQGNSSISITDSDKVKLASFFDLILKLPSSCEKSFIKSSINSKISNPSNGLTSFVIEEPTKLTTTYMPVMYLKSMDDLRKCAEELQEKFKAFKERLKKAKDYAGRVNVFYEFLLETIFDKPDGSGYYTLKQKLWKIQIFMAEFLLYIGWLVKTINNVLMKSTEHKHCIKTEMTHIESVLLQFCKIHALSDTKISCITLMTRSVRKYRKYILGLLETHCKNSAQCYLYKCALHTTQIKKRIIQYKKTADLVCILAFAAGTSSFAKLVETLEKQGTAVKILSASNFISHKLFIDLDLRMESIAILRSMIEFFKTIKPVKTKKKETLNFFVSLKNCTIMILPQTDPEKKLVRICSGGEITDYFHRQIYDLFSE